MNIFGALQTFSNLLTKNIGLVCLVLFPLSGLAATSAAKWEKRIERFAAIGKETIEKRCKTNLMAGVDRKMASERWESACAGTYWEMQEAAQAYLDKRSAAAAEIEKAQSAEERCKSESPGDVTGQAACLERVAGMLLNAAKLEKDLQGELNKAIEKIKKAREQNAKAKRKYKEDLAKIDIAIQNEIARAEKLQDSNALYEVDKKLMSAQAVSGQTLSLTPSANAEVTADDGGASTITGYKNQIKNSLNSSESGLVGEQEYVLSQTSEFMNAAAEQRSVHLQKAQTYETQAQSLRNQAALLGNNIPVPTKDPRKAATDPNTGSMGDLGKKGAGNETKSDLSGGSRTGESDLDSSDDSSVASDDGVGNTPRSSSGMGDMASAASQAAGAMGGGAGGGSSGGGASSSGPDYSDYQPFTGAEPTKDKSLDSTAVSLLGGESPKADSSLDAPEEKVASEETGATEESNFNLGYESGSDLSQSDGTASSRLSPKGGSSMKPTGVSGAGGAGGVFGSDGYSSGAGAEGFEDANLASSEGVDLGALGGSNMSMAGSETDAAIASLMADLQGTGNMELSKDGLTEAERLALNPGGAFRSFASDDESDVHQASGIASVDGEGLFVRVHEAHKRNLKRGNLILGLKKKLK